MLHPYKIKPLFIGLFILLSIPCLKAQNEQKVLLTEVLGNLEQSSNVRFTYNFSLFQYLKVNEPDYSKKLRRVLGNISKEYPFIEFEQNDPANIRMISSFPSTLVIKAVKDSESGLSVVEYQAYIENGGIQTTTSRDSAILINVLPIDTIHISADGYEQLKIIASQLRQKNGFVSLDPQYIYLPAVELSSYFNTGISTNLNNHSLEVDMNKLGLLAGETEGDIFQLFKALPGIRSPNGKPGSFNLRGNLFNQNLIYLDYIPVYHNGHYFGTFSPYNPKIVENIEVFRNSLPSNWGGRVGGLLNLESANDVPNSLKANAFVNTVFGGASLKTPIVKDKLALILGFRGNLGINSPKLEEYSELNFQGSRIDFRKLDDEHVLDRNEVHFNDFNGKVVFQANKNHQLSLSFLNIANSSDHLFLSLNQDEYDGNISQLSNWGSSFRWNGKFSEKTSIEALASLSQLNISEQKTEGIISSSNETKFDAVKNQIQDQRLSVKGNHDFNPSHRISIGYEYKNQHIDFYSTVIEMGVVDRITERNDSASTHALFANYRSLLGLKWIINLGIRAENYSLTEQSFLEPRINASYLLSSLVNLKSAIGRSHQYVQQRIGTDFNDFKVSNQFWILSNNENPVLESDKIMFGAVLKTKEWLLDLEIFAQETRDISRKIGPTPTLFGDQMNIGMDLMLRKNWKYWQSWISYTVAQTDLDFGESNRAYFDQTHVLSINASMVIKKFKATASWSYMSGLPINLANAVNLPYTTNFPDQHQLDIGATYSWISKDSKWRGIFGVSLINVYNQELIVNQFVNAPNFDNSLRMALGFTPGIQLSLSR